MQITVVGAGYVGLVTAACFADIGHDVWCVDTDASKIAALRSGVSPIFEPDLPALLERHTAHGRLRFTTDLAESVPGSRLVFIAVGTPSGDSGEVDLGQVHAAVDGISPLLSPGVTVVMKSTVPVGTTREVADRLAARRPDLEAFAAANPEFLRQGSAVEDFMNPDRLVIGTTDRTSEQALHDAYAPLIDRGVPTISADPETAELIKYASNSLLAIKLSFINEIADLCEASGASVGVVAHGIGLDPRIGPSYLNAGPGFGGSCLPKDIQGLLHTTSRYGARSHIVAAAVEVNSTRKKQMVEKIAAAIDPIEGARVAVLGVTFKAGTDDIRHSPAVDIISGLVSSGAEVRLYDPQGMERAKTALPAAVEYAADAYDAMAQADGVVIATEWPEFAELNFERVRQTLGRPILVDLRNLYAPDRVAAAGLRYVSVGRPPAEPAQEA